jgi:hypothetical protein
MENQKQSNILKSRIGIVFNSNDMLQEIEKFITETKKILSSQHNPKQNEQC